jgi:DNA-binding beta-propeller fold protein YncE
VDAQDHVWIIHRAASMDAVEAAADEGTGTCCKKTPPVLEFDQAGNLLRHWGGEDGAGYQWPASNHGLTIDHKGNIWIGGNGAANDGHILKFTPDGKFLMQVGIKQAGLGPDSNSQERFYLVAKVSIDPKTNEVYVADGYGNKRVVVFDAKSGAYKRHWGAYGAQPSDERQAAYDPNQPPAKQFGNPVHCVRLASDGLVYVCDRVNNRIQVFEPSGKFLHEMRVEPLTRANGSVWDMVLSHDAAQKFMYVADGANGRVYVLSRADGAQLSSFGRTGRMAGEFKWVHNIAIDRQGNLYTSEVGFGRRVQKFVLLSF